MFRTLVACGVCLTTLSAGSTARADDNPGPTDPTSATSAAAPSAPLPAADAPSPPFAVDPIADGALIVGTGAFAGILELVIGTGEIRPQQITPDFDKSKLLGIDRGAISQNVDSSALPLSNVGILTALGYAALDPVLSGIREKDAFATLVDATIYAETITITLAVTDLAKIAVRRPRPQAYIDAEAHKGDPNYVSNVTDSSLSFFSGHASMTAAVSATATYLAFVRSPDTARPWITLGVGTALTSFVSIERVRGGAHFPTDVIAGAIAGAGVGVCVAHLHRNEDSSKRRVWVGFDSAPGGGTATLGGVF